VHERDRVCLSEVLISAPPSDDPAQVTEANHKAERLRNVVQKGGSFAGLAATPTGQRRRKEGQLAVLSGVNFPSNLKSGFFRCRLVRYPMSYVPSRAS